MSLLVTAVRRNCAALALALTLPGPAAATDGNWYRMPYGVTGAHGGPYLGLAVAIDTRRERALVFGGLRPGVHYGPGWYGDAFGVNFVQTMDPSHGIALMSVAGLPPTRVAYSAAAYDSLADRLWVFAGDSIVSGSMATYTSVPTDGVWSLDLSQSPAVWTRVFPAGSAPAARSGHSMVFDPIGRRLVVFGGRATGEVALDDTWSLSVDGTPTWTRLAAGSVAPAARYQHGAAYDPFGQRVLVQGGLRAGTNTLAPGGLWSLTLAGAPGWDSVATSGPAPAGLVGGLGFDRARNRLVVVPTPSTPASLNLTVDPPAWTPIAFAADPSLAAYLTTSMAFDDRKDVLYLPAPTMYCAAYNSCWPEHFLVAFDRAPRATAEPHLTEMAWLHGAALQRWQANLSGMSWSPPHLERRIGGGASIDCGAFTSSDEIAGTMDFADAGPTAGSDITYRLTWRDYASNYASGDTLVHAPDAPVAMSSTVDSAYVLAGSAHLQWTLANDSLSLVAQPGLWRRTDATGWKLLARLWPDDQRRVRYVDTTLVGDVPNDFELRWSQLGSVRSTGAVSLVGRSSVASFVSAECGPHWIRTSWSVNATNASTVFKIVRFTPESGTWDTLGVLDTEPAGERSFEDRPLNAGTTYIYRVVWTSPIGIVGATPDMGVQTLEETPPAALSFASPVHGAAAITFTIPATGSATLELYDIRGRLRWSRAEQGPARMTRTVPSGTVEPGIYFLRLRSEAAVLTRRIVMLP